MLRQVAVIGLLGLTLGASPVVANETSAIAGSVAGGIAQGIVCAAARLGMDEDEIDAEAYDRPGFFLGGGASYVIEQFTGDVTSNLEVARFEEGESGLLGERTDDVFFDNSYGVNGYLGYRCHPRFSFEVQFEWVEGFEADVDKIPSGKVGTTDLEPIVVTSNLKAYLLTGKTQPYILTGLGIMRAEFKERDTTVFIPPGSNKQRSRESRFAMRFGGGIDHYLTKNMVVDLKVDYVISFSLDVDYVLVGGGFQYRF